MTLLLPMLKIDSMSSLEIAELTGKRHANVLRDIREMLTQIKEPGSNMSYEQIQGVTVSTDSNGRTAEIRLNERYTWVLITGYSAKLRDAVIARWKYLEEQLRIVKFKEGDKKHQLAAMEALQGFLPDDLQGEPLSFMKANTIVNKAVSNLFGFPKMLKKDEMSNVMLEARERVLDDYLKLYEVLEDNGKVKEILYNKYQPKRIEII